MGQVLYERPREKRRYRGIRSLSLIELVQLVIGSGSSRLSGAKLARMVERLIIERRVSYETLTALQGVGEAKACQILAALEIGERLRGIDE